MTSAYSSPGLLFRVFLLFLLFNPPGSIAQSDPPTDDWERKSQISDAGYVEINGIDQWITITGNRSKPVILFLHGGPGSPLSPYASTIYQELENEFLLVQWDQRGAGKTYAKQAPEELTPAFLNKHPLSIEQMTEDGIALTKYLLQYLGKKKLILFGTSWGSVLGVKMATDNPDLFYAYVGHSQVVHPSIDSSLYYQLHRIARYRKDTVSLRTLTEIGKPPYDRARKTGQLIRILKAYEAERSDPPPANWFLASKGYDEEKDIRLRADGDDYSFVNYVGDQVLGVSAMNKTIDLTAQNPEFSIPVYFIQGREDLLTPAKKTKAYFRKIKAPLKKFYLLPRTAHGYNRAVLQTQIRIFRQIKAE